MTPTSREVITPEPFYKIAFGCSNRAFYGVKNELYEIADRVGIELSDGYISESCDFEGDLEKIRIYRGDRGKEFVLAVLEHYGVTDDVAEDMDICLCIF